MSKTVIFFVLAALMATPATTARADEGLQVATGKAKFNGLVQSWFVSDSTGVPTSDFRIRRAEMKLSGSVFEDTRWFIMVDPAKTPGSDPKILQDVGVGWTFVKDAELIVGQMKNLTTAEGLDSSSELLFPERSRVGRKYGDQRVIGAQLFYRQETWKVGTMISNGGNTNTDDTTTAKDLAIRADVNPIKPLSFGAFILAKDMKFANNRNYGVDARWMGEAEVLRFEYAASHNAPNSRGYVIEGGYRIEKFLPMLRYENIKSNLNNNWTSNGFTIGLNYYHFKNNVKVQASYALLNDFNGNNGTYVETATNQDLKTRLLTLNFQIAI